MAREWDLLPFWLRSIALEKEDTKPFRSYIVPYTLTQYIGYWQSYILLCYQMYNLYNQQLEFTRIQLYHLTEVWSLINQYTEDQALQLKQALFHLSVSLICHSDYIKEPSSLIYYTGIREYNINYKQ